MYTITDLDLLGNDQGTVLTRAKFVALIERFVSQIQAATRKVVLVGDCEARGARSSISSTTLAVRGPHMLLVHALSQWEAGCAGRLQQALETAWRRGPGATS